MSDFVSYKSEISDFLDNFLKTKQQDLASSYFSKNVFERLLPLAVNGKMLRGSLLINTYEKLSGQKFSKESLAAAAALELAQTGFLIHDDIIDQDELRRGQPTLHSQYSKVALQKKYQQPEHVGESYAICIGDITFFLVYELLASKLVKVFSHQLSVTAFGEMQDVELALMPGDKVTQESILQMYTDKTASYSICLPLMAGAILTDQNKTTLLQLNELGQTLGIIFQIKDDEIGLFGDQEKTGKPVGADIREGKKTLYYLYLLQAAVDQENLSQSFGNQNLDEAGVIATLNLIDKYGVKEKVAQDLTQLESQAKKQINNLQLSAEFKQMMVQFLDKIINRVR